MMPSIRGRCGVRSGRELEGSEVHRRIWEIRAWDVVSGQRNKSPSREGGAGRWVGRSGDIDSGERRVEATHAWSGRGR